MEVILAKGPDVTTYLKNGVVDLGIVGSDVLDEQDDMSYEMLDLQTGKCQFILASLAGYDPKEGRRQRLVRNIQLLQTSTLELKTWKSSRLKDLLSWPHL